MEGFLGIGGNELFIILLFAFLIFGPDKLPGIARTIGRAIAKFRDAQNEVNEVIRQEVYDPATDKDNPLQKVSEKAADLNRKEPPKTESFAERKARYDKIRAERRAMEEAAAREAAAKAGQADGAAKAPDEAADLDVDALLGVAPATPAAAAAPATPAAPAAPATPAAAAAPATPAAPAATAATGATSGDTDAAPNPMPRKGGDA